MEKKGQVVGETSLASKDVKSRDFRVVLFLSPAGNIMKCPSFSQILLVTNKFGTETRDNHVNDTKLQTTTCVLIFNSILPKTAQRRKKYSEE